MSLITLFHKIHLLGAFPIHPIHPWVKSSCFIPVQEREAAAGGLPPTPFPTVLLAWGPSGPGDARMLGSEALWLRAEEEKRLWCLPGHQLL